jgi:carbon-monoxide dehydrogenase iron sulfur subunit
VKQVLVLPEKCTGCRRCEAACQESHDRAPGVSGSPRLVVVYHRGRYYPSLCRHCADAPCLDACMSGALGRDPGSGAVYVDAERCRGCWMCLMACPFGAIRADETAGLAHKCDGCFRRGEPACAAVCEPGALVYAEGAAVERGRRRRRTRLADLEGR